MRNTHHPRFAATALPGCVSFSTTHRGRLYVQSASHCLGPGGITNRNSIALSHPDSEGVCFRGADFADELTDTFQGGWVPGTPEPGGAIGEGGDDFNSQCIYGSFMVRLNSSPGTKHVQRQYLGEPVLVVEEELVQIVITPDTTAQTIFDPPSVTFTHTGGRVGGADTYRWDEPATFKVVPRDDNVDERAGVTIDFTSFTITQSHFGDTYWDYTVPYQLHPVRSFAHCPRPGWSKFSNSIALTPPGSH